LLQRPCKKCTNAGHVLMLTCITDARPLAHATSPNRAVVLGPASRRSFVPWYPPVGKIVASVSHFCRDCFPIAFIPARPIRAVYRKEQRMRHTCPTQWSSHTRAPRASMASLTPLLMIGADSLWGKAGGSGSDLSPRQVVAESDPATTITSLCFQHMACMARPGQPAGS